MQRQHATVAARGRGRCCSPSPSACSCVLPVACRRQRPKHDERNCCTGAADLQRCLHHGCQRPLALRLGPNCNSCPSPPHLPFPQAAASRDAVMFPPNCLTSRTPRCSPTVRPCSPPPAPGRGVVTGTACSHAACCSQACSPLLRAPNTLPLPVPVNTCSKYCVVGGTAFYMPTTSCSSSSASGSPFTDACCTTAAAAPFTSTVDHCSTTNTPPEIGRAHV